MRFQPFFLVIETPLHAGTGSELGIVDLPIQRERHTNFPKIEASGLKGCFRESFSSTFSKKKEMISLVFGPEEGDLHAGAIAFMEAKILFFPVKSLKGVFAWITCPQVIERFKKDMRAARFDLSNFQGDVKEGTVSSNELTVMGDQIVLEEFTFKVRKDSATESLAYWFAEKIFKLPECKYWSEKFKSNLVVLSDDEFTDFVTHSTEVITRTQIDSTTGTVKQGALWTEEYLPQDTVLYSIAMASPLRTANDGIKGSLKADSPEGEAEKVIKFFIDNVPEVLQIGGNQTIGKGLTRVQLLIMSGGER